MTTKTIITSKIVYLQIRALHFLQCRFSYNVRCLQKARVANIIIYYLPQAERVYENRAEHVFFKLHNYLVITRSAKKPINCYITRRCLPFILIIRDLFTRGSIKSILLLKYDNILFRKRFNQIFQYPCDPTILRVI